MKTIKTLLITLLITNVTSSQIQIKQTKSANYEINLEEWSILENWMKSNTRLDRYIIGNKIKSQNINEFSKLSGDDNCSCGLFYVNLNNSVNPFEPAEYDNSESQDGYKRYTKNLQYGSWGAAKKSNLELYGKRTKKQFSNKISDPDQGSSSNAAIFMYWICLREQLPDECNCRKKVRVKSLYETKLETKNETGGIWSKASISKIEDAVIVTTTEEDGNLEVLDAGVWNLETTLQEDVNEEWVITSVKLLGNILTDLNGEEGTIDFNSYADQVGDLISTGYYETTGENASGDGKITTGSTTYESTNPLYLIPNKWKKIRINSYDYSFVKGYGRRYNAATKLASDYALTAVIEFDPEPYGCCSQQLGIWSDGYWSQSPSTSSNLWNLIETFMLNLGTPWVSLSPIQSNSGVEMGSVLCERKPDIIKTDKQAEKTKHNNR